MKFAHKVACAALVLAAAATAHAASTRNWTIVVLPTLTEYGGSARAVNNRGEVVGTSSVNPTEPHPVIWANGVVTDLLPGNPAIGVANDVNDQGVVAATDGASVIVWKDGRATSLGIAGEPHDINKSGGVVGSYYPSGEIARGPQNGFYYKDGVLHDIGSLGNNLTAASGVNDKGVVVGYSRLPFSSTDHAVVWENGVLRDLGTLGGTNSYALDVTDHGVVVGTADAADGSFWMFLSATQGGMKPVLQWVSPMAINDRGSIVGNNVRTGHAILYEDGLVTDLRTLPAFIDGGWTSFTPFGINDRDWIAGIGYRPGSPWQGTPLLLIPENGGGKPKG
jgi:probable HAF family extracellular repeat protein